MIAGVLRNTAAASGIYRSTDGGVNWTLVLPGAAGTDVVFAPDGLTLYAALGTASGDPPNAPGPVNGVYKSTDAGATWTLSNGTGANSIVPILIGRISLSVSASNPRILLAGVHNPQSGGLQGLYRSTDSAATWTRLTAAPDYCTPQCSYDMPVAIHPSNPNVLVVGGLYVYRSTNGGTSWTNIYRGFDGEPVHADHHALAFTKDGALLFDASDGGVASTTEVLTSTLPNWTNLSSTLSTGEFAAATFGIHPSDPTKMIAGAQDNGTMMYDGDPAWKVVVGGDGGYGLIDRGDPSILYNTLPGITIRKRNPYLQYSFFQSAVHGINQGDRSNFYSPLIDDAADPQRMYFSTYRVYASADGAGQWKVISPELTARGSGAINIVAVAPSDSRVIYAGTTDAHVQVTREATANGLPVWTDVSKGLPNRAVTFIAVDQYDAATAYVTYSGFSGFNGDDQGHVFVTSDSGQSWTDISGGLPNSPVNSIAADPDIPNTIYVGTDVGVFRSSDRGANWSPLGSGLPRGLALGLTLHRPSRILRTSIYGRGLWDLQLPGASGAPVVSSVSNVVSGKDQTITVSGKGLDANSVVRWNGLPLDTKFAAGKLTASLQSGDSGPGRATVAVYSSTPGVGLSLPFDVTVGGPPAVTLESFRSHADGGNKPLVSGSLASVYGTNLAPRYAAVEVNTYPLPTSLAGTAVEFDGGAAPLVYVSPNQLVFQVPWSYQEVSRAPITVVNGKQRSNTLQVPLTGQSPSLYSADQTGNGQGLVLLATEPTALAAPAPTGAYPKSRPAKRGEEIDIYASGLGTVTFPPTSGTPPSPNFRSLTRTPVVTLGGVAAKVSFSALAPNSIGLYQVRVTIPASAPTGSAIPVRLSIEGASSSNAVTIAVE